MKRLLLLFVALAVVVGLGGSTPASAKDHGDTDACKHGGWQTLSRPDGTGFTNQGDCVSHAAHGGMFGVPASCTIERSQHGATATVTVNCAGLMPGTTVDVIDTTTVYAGVYASGVVSPAGTASFSAVISCFPSVSVVGTTASGQVQTLAVAAPHTTPCAEVPPPL